ncbi:MAG: amphi-Trp domain-containing protein [Thermodesulfobacteriota bacterium]
MENDSGNKRKAKHTFTSQEAVSYLRRLADQLEAGTIQISDEELEFGGQVKVKESFKSAKGTTVVKVQFKFSSPEAASEASEEMAEEAEAEPAAAAPAPPAPKKTAAVRRKAPAKPKLRAKAKPAAKKASAKKKTPTAKVQ